MTWIDRSIHHEKSIVNGRTDGRREGGMARTENPQIDFVTKGGEGIFQIAPEADERESCRQVALLVHHETRTGGDSGDETYDRI